MLKFVCNVIFYYRHFPFIWRCGTISALEKSLKVDFWDLETYRGITHTHQGGKFVEILIFYRVRYTVGDNISKYQSGGRARCGAVQQLIRIVEDIQVFINQDRPTRKGRGFKNYVILVLLDASKAFDRVFRPILLAKIREEGIDGLLFEVIVAYFSGRHQRVRVNNSFSEYV